MTAVSASDPYARSAGIPVSRQLRSRPIRLALPVACAILLPCLGGCAVVSVAASVAGAAISVTSTVVTTGVKVVGAVVETTVDAASSGPAQAAAPASSGSAAAQSADAR